MAVDQDAIDMFQPQIDSLVARVDVLEAQPNSGALFAARDNLETALFSAMQGLTDAEQVVFLESLTAQISTQGN